MEREAGVAAGVLFLCVMVVAGLASDPFHIESRLT